MFCDLPSTSRNPPKNMLYLWGSYLSVDLEGEYKKLYLVNKSPLLISSTT